MPGSATPVAITFQQVLTLSLVVGVFAWLGYKGGYKRWMLYLAGIYSFYTMLSDKPIRNKSIEMLNGLYTGIMLAVHGGLGALGRGDLKAAEATIKGIHAPFSEDAATGMILGIVILVLVLFIGNWSKLKGGPSLIGAALGATVGYIMAVTFAPSLPSSLPLYPWKMQVKGTSATGNDIVAQTVNDLTKMNLDLKLIIIVSIVVVLLLSGFSIKPKKKQG